MYFAHLVSDKYQVCYVLLINLPLYYYEIILSIPGYDLSSEITLSDINTDAPAFKNLLSCIPDWCGSVGWALFHKI